MKKETKNTIYVLGDTKTGFKISKRKPKTKYVPEPFSTMESAQRWIAYQYGINA